MLAISDQPIPPDELQNYVIRFCRAADGPVPVLYFEGKRVTRAWRIDLADYSGLGPASIVETASPQASLKYTLVGTAGGIDPDTGDIYRALDRFGRIKDLLWYNTVLTTKLGEVQHDYDRASKRLWRGELADPGRLHEELYQYDKLYRLKELQRGSLTAGDTAIANQTFEQCWSLDETGNLSGLQEDDTGSGELCFRRVLVARFARSAAN